LPYYWSNITWSTNPFIKKTLLLAVVGSWTWIGDSSGRLVLQAQHEEFPARHEFLEISPSNPAQVYAGDADRISQVEFFQPSGIGYGKNLVDVAGRPSKRLAYHVYGIAKPSELDDCGILPRENLYFKTIFGWWLASGVFFSGATLEPRAMAVREPPGVPPAGFDHAIPRCGLGSVSILGIGYMRPAFRADIFADFPSATRATRLLNHGIAFLAFDNHDYSPSR
jgi:hypothetical protein